MEEDSKQPTDEPVDSDDEYVKESNYSTLKQVWHQYINQKYYVMLNFIRLQNYGDTNCYHIYF